jgi:hypothetical protein
MRITINNINTRFNKIPETSSWNNEVKEELKMHKIHVYPAKFPSFLISKSLQYAARNGIEVNSIGDIFCGCGTTALEAKKNNKEFWGCDINPVATLIAKVKREKYLENTLDTHYENILSTYEAIVTKVPKDIATHQRLMYWFKSEQIQDLYRLLKAIKENVPKGKYQDFFLVAFSNILKRTSKWLTKSIKPTIDPKKPVHNVQRAFQEQFKMMYKAVQDANKKVLANPKSIIVNKNFLSTQPKAPFLDMLITSPPYVTSYEYADLHQLSTLWLGYANDFKELRNGTIGSLYHQELSKKDIASLDPMALETYDALVKAKNRSPKAALKYFLDIKNTVNKTYSIINPKGLAVFVIGNTTHRGIYIDNAKYLTKCMLTAGFTGVEAFKRKISSKILTPYRDNNGKFSSNKRHKKIYSYEFIIIARKPADM